MGLMVGTNVFIRFGLAWGQELLFESWAEAGF
jgi:hypothetical protein